MSTAQPTAAQLIDGAVADRVIVYGSLPPAGRDLDLLARSREGWAIAATLTDRGFAHRGSEWVRFARCTAEIVELTDAASWQMTSEEREALFADALVLEGMRNLARPAPHHALLIIAVRLARGDGTLPEKLRARVERAVLEDPQAWRRAARHAPAWRAAGALAALEQTLRTGTPVSRRRRVGVRRELMGARGLRLRGARRGLARLRRTLPGARRRTIVAFSGLDGAGKSVQAAALAETLERLGHDAIVVRTRIGWDDWLWPVARPVKRLLGSLLRMLAAPRRARPRVPAESTGVETVESTAATPGESTAATPGESTAATPGESTGVTPGESTDATPGESTGATPPSPSRDGEPDPVTSLREASALLTDLWTLTITIANASAQWRLMRRALRRGAVVVCDRYTLDSIVELRYTYGRDRPLRTARAALSRLYPRPLRAYLLDVQPDTALARKGEWGIDWLRDHRELYLLEAAPLGVRVIDGQRSREEICAEVAREVWLSGI